MKSSIPKAFTKVVHLLSLSLMVSLAGCFRSIQADDFVDARLEAHPFALNIDIHADKDAEHRIPIGLDSLATLGIMSDVR